MKKERRRQLAALLSAAVFGSSMSAYAETETSARHMSGRAARSGVIANPLYDRPAGTGRLQIGAPVSRDESMRASGRVIRNSYALPDPGTIQIGPARLQPSTAPTPGVASAHDVVPAGHSSSVRLVKPREAVLNVEPAAEQRNPNDAVNAATITDDPAEPVGENAVVFKLDDSADEPDPQIDAKRSAPSRQMSQEPADEAQPAKNTAPEESTAGAADRPNASPSLFRPPVKILQPITGTSPDTLPSPERPEKKPSAGPVKLGAKGFIGSISDDGVRSPEPLVQVGTIGQVDGDKPVRETQSETAQSETTGNRTNPAPLAALPAPSASPKPLVAEAKDEKPTKSGEQKEKTVAVSEPATPRPADTGAGQSPSAPRRAVRLAGPVAAAADAIHAGGGAAPVEALGPKMASAEPREQSGAAGRPSGHVAAAPVPLLKIRRPESAAVAEPASPTRVPAAAQGKPQIASTAAPATQPRPTLIQPANEPLQVARAATVESSYPPRPAAQQIAVAEPAASRGTQPNETLEADPSTGRLQLAIGTPFTFETRQRIARVQLEDDGLCEAVQIDPRRVMIVGKAPGNCRLAVWFEAPAAISRQLIEIDVSAPAASNELSQLSEKLATILIATYPDQRLRIDVDGKSLVVKGRVTSEEIARDALRIVRNACLRPVKDEIEVFDR